MDAVKYLKEKTRMCKSYNIDCNECPMNIDNNGIDGLYCGDFSDAYPEKAVEIVEKWSKEHPQKTYLSDFLEKYPNAPMADDGVPMLVCPYYFGYMTDQSDGRCGEDDGCVRCWNTPMEDDA